MEYFFGWFSNVSFAFSAASPLVLPGSPIWQTLTAAFVSASGLGLAMYSQNASLKQIKDLRKERRLEKRDIETCLKELPLIEEALQRLGDSDSSRLLAELSRLKSTLRELHAIFATDPRAGSGQQADSGYELSYRQQHVYQTSDGEFRRRMKAAGMLLKHEWE